MVGPVQRVQNHVEAISTGPVAILAPHVVLVAVGKSLLVDAVANPIVPAQHPRTLARVPTATVRRDLRHLALVVPRAIHLII